MIPEWVSAALLVYMVLDGSLGMYFKHKYQGPYSDGKIGMVTLIPLLTIPSIIICKMFGYDHIIKRPGVHKISWKEYKEIRKGKEAAK